MKAKEEIKKRIHKNIQDLKKLEELFPKNDPNDTVQTNILWNANIEQQNIIFEEIIRLKYIYDNF